MSLYNESFGIDIDPTPVIGVLGPHRPAGRPPPGRDAGRRGCAGAARRQRGRVRRPPESTVAGRLAVGRRAPGHRNGTLPALDLAGHRRLVEFVTGLVAEGLAGDGGGWRSAGDGRGRAAAGARGSTMSRAVGSGSPWPRWPSARAWVAGGRRGRPPRAVHRGAVPGGCLHHPAERADLAGGRGRGRVPGTRGRRRPTAGRGGPGRPRPGRGHRRMAGPAPSLLDEPHLSCRSTAERPAGTRRRGTDRGAGGRGGVSDQASGRRASSSPTTRSGTLRSPWPVPTRRSGLINP